MTPVKESEMLCRRLEQLCGEIDADTARLRSSWQRSPFSSRWLLSGLAGLGVLLFSARSASMVRQAGVKPLIAATAVKLLVRALSKRR